VLQINRSTFVFLLSCMSKTYLKVDATQILHKQKKQIAVIQFLCQLCYHNICLWLRLSCTVQHVFNVYKILAHIFLCLKEDVFHRRNQRISATTYLFYLLVAAFQRIYRLLQSLHHLRWTLLGLSKQRHVFLQCMHLMKHPKETEILYCFLLSRKIPKQMFTMFESAILRYSLLNKYIFKYINIFSHTM